MFLANNKPLWKIYAELSIAEPKNKYDQVIENYEPKLKIHFKVFSYYNMSEVEWSQ